MSHADCAAAFELFRSTEYSLSHPSLVQLGSALRDSAGVLNLQGQPERLFEGEASTDTLVVLFLHGAGALALMRVPMARIDTELELALERLHGRTFAGGADLARADWDHAALVLSALGADFTQPQDFVHWAQEEGATVAPDALLRRWNVWQGADVIAWSQLVDPVAKLCAIARAD